MPNGSSYVNNFSSNKVLEISSEKLEPQKALSLEEMIASIVINSHEITMNMLEKINIDNSKQDRVSAERAKEILELSLQLSQRVSGVSVSNIVDASPPSKPSLVKMKDSSSKNQYKKSELTANSSVTESTPISNSFKNLQTSSDIQPLISANSKNYVNQMALDLNRVDHGVVNNMLGSISNSEGKLDYDLLGKCLDNLSQELEEYEKSLLKRELPDNSESSSIVLDILDSPNHEMKKISRLDSDTVNRRNLSSSISYVSNNIDRKGKGVDRKNQS